MAIKTNEYTRCVEVFSWVIAKDENEEKRIQNILIEHPDFYEYLIDPFILEIQENIFFGGTDGIKNLMRFYIDQLREIAFIYNEYKNIIFTDKEFTHFRSETDCQNLFQKIIIRNYEFADCLFVEIQRICMRFDVDYYEICDSISFDKEMFDCSYTEMYHQYKGSKKLEKHETDNTQKKLKWEGQKNQLYDVIRQLKKKELIANSYTEIATFICQNLEGFEKNFITVLKEIQKEERPAKNKRIDLDLSELLENDT